MGNKIRTYDKNIKRKANKQFHQFEKNIFEKNNFSYIAIVKEVIDTHWCRVRLIPSVSINEFEIATGYSDTYFDNPVVKVFRSTDVAVVVDDVVLITFTDVNFRKTLISIINGKNKSLQFKEQDQTKHSLNFGIITNKIL